MPATLRPVDNGPEFDLKNAHLDETGAMRVPILTAPFGEKRFTEEGLRASVATCDALLAAPRDRTPHPWDALFRAALERFEELSAAKPAASPPEPAASPVPSSPAAVPPPPPEDPRRRRSMRATRSPSP